MAASTPGKGYTQTNRLLKAIWAYDLVSAFKNGYRNREDNTILPAGVLIFPSKNVLTNTAQRLGIRKGYTLDGTKSSVAAPILGAYDYEMHTGDIRHLRSGFLTTVGNDGKLQYRYVAPTGTVTWRDLMTGLTNTTINFTNFWDATGLQSHCLFVMGDSNIYDWSGGVTTIASVTSNTITKQGTDIWALSGFTQTGSVVINGVTYTYSGGYDTTTLTGVSPDPTGHTITAGDIAHQAIVTVANGSNLGLKENDVISSLNNQIYVGSLVENSAFISKQNSYTDYSFSTPRKPWEGATLYLDRPVTGFLPQEQNMYISCGQSYWYQIGFTQATDAINNQIYENVDVQRLKTGALQGAQSQYFISHDKNDAVFITNEPTLSSLGRVESILGTPQTTDISWPIINDFNSYDFTDGSVAYWKNYLLVAIPKEGLIRIYNQTDPKNPYWEAPQTIPVSRFSIIDGNLYGHSYLTSDSYKLFDGYNDIGEPIEALAQFSFMDMGSRVKKKGFNLWWTEGYITQNGNLKLGLQYDMDGRATFKSWLMSGISKFVFLPKNTSPLGKLPLGKQPIGSQINAPEVPPLPPHFKWQKQMPTSPLFWELSPSYYSNDIDFQWEIISFGPNFTMVTDTNSEISG